MKLKSIPAAIAMSALALTVSANVHAADSPKVDLTITATNNGGAQASANASTNVGPVRVTVGGNVNVAPNTPPATGGSLTVTWPK